VPRTFASIASVIAAALLLAAPAGAATHRHAGARHAGARHATKRHPHSRKPRHHTAAAHTTSAPTAPAASAPAASPEFVPAPPCANTDVTPNVGNIEAVTISTLCLINQQRADAGLQMMSVNPLLTQAALQHDQDMVTNNYFAHVAPDGSTPLQRLEDVGYVLAGVGYSVGENLAWGTDYLSTPAQIVNAWMNSPEHRANILNPDYRETGMAVIPSVPSSMSGGSPGAIYDQEFGVIVQ
jgi:uncharacterized protein YkwD